MKLNPDSLPAKLFKAFIEKEKRDSRRRPTMLFVGEKKQLWYFLMNQIDQTPEDGGEQETGEN